MKPSSSKKPGSKKSGFKLNRLLIILVLFCVIVGLLEAFSPSASVQRGEVSFDLGWFPAHAL